MAELYTRELEQAIGELLASPVGAEARECGRAVVVDVLAATVAGSAALGVTTVANGASFTEGNALFSGLIDRSPRRRPP